MGKGVVKLGEGQWATKDGKLLAAKETNGRFKNAEFTVTRGSDATYTDKDGLIKRVSAPRNRATTSSNTLDLFVLAGQSNAMGWLGNASGYPPQEPNLLDSSIKLNYEQIGTTSKSDGWQTLGPQQRQNYGEIFGPEVTFSRLLKRGGYNPAIFKYTQGSTSLADDWKAPGQSGHYDTMVTKFNSAVLDLQNQGYVVNIAGFIWIQGEQDATDSTDASNYQSNLNAIISDFRTNVASNSTLQFVLGVDEGNPASNIGTIVAAQNNIANGDVNIVRSSMVGLEKADSTHLTPAGIIDHGKRIYDSMFDLASAEPRIDFTDNTDGHLLLEPQSTNLITYSEDFTQYSDNDAQVLSSTHVNPDGSNNAKVLAYNGGSVQHYISTTPSVNSGQNYTFSVFVKAKELNYVCLIFLNDLSGKFFNLQNGTRLGNFGSEPADSKIEDYGNGWYRCSITDSATSTTKFCGIYLSDDGTSINSTPTTTSGVYIWGAQLENLPYPTSYIPTSGSQVTRDAETCTSAGEAADFNTEEGVLYAEIASLAEVNQGIAISNGTYDSRVLFYFDTSGNIRGYIFVSGNQFQQTTSGVDYKSLTKMAIKYSATSTKFYVNGNLIGTEDTSSTMPSALNQLSLHDGGGGNKFYGKVKAIKVYKEALSDSELVTLTS